MRDVDWSVDSRVRANLFHSQSHPAPVYPVGVDIRSVAVADFDGDGKPDLVVANADSSSVSVLEHVGLGEPAINNTYTVGTFPLVVVTGDFTGDGKPDIVTANDSSSNISLLRNNGSGGFVADGTFNSGPGVSRSRVILTTMANFASRVALALALAFCSVTARAASVRR